MTDTSDDNVLLAAITRSAEEFSSGKGWPDGVQNLLENLGRATGCSLTWLTQTIEHDSYHALRDMRFEWSAEERYSQIGGNHFNMYKTSLLDSYYGQIVAERAQGKWHTLIIAEAPDCAMKKDWIRQGIKSTLTIPIMVNGTWWGTLGFDDHLRQHVWTDGDINIVRMASYMIANSVVRQQLAANQRRFNIIEKITGSGAWEIDFRQRQSWLSDTLLESLGVRQYGASQGLLSVIRLIHPEDRKRLFKLARDCVADNHENFRMDLRMKGEGEVYYWFDLLSHITLDGDGYLQGLSGIAVDIRSKKKVEISLREIARTDSLTGLANRRHLDETLAKEFDRAHRYSQPLGLLLLDIDHFKILNDTYGHTRGDQVLRALGRLLKDHFRDVDHPCRFGGEEFAVVLPGTGLAAAMETAERLRRRIESSNFSGLPMTMSIGVGALPEINVTNAGELLTATDRALYEAKRTGRNRLCLAHEGHLVAFNSKLQ
ncbi:MAG TPA: diguanylate cyclase [Rhodospirillales bacterium]|nr:diguanylate cyclase [Rhodospirillales bacterium]